MISWGEPYFDIEGLHYVPVGVGDEAVAVVGDGCPVDPIPGYPLDKGLGDLWGRGRGHGVALQPPASAAEDGQDEPVALGLWERANNIQMNC